MQTIAPTTTVHDTSSLFVDNLNLSVHNDIVGIFFEHGISFQQLINCMNTFRLDGKVCKQLVFLGKLFFVAQSLFIFQSRKLSCNIRQHEECRILRVTCNQINTLICQIYTFQFFIDNEVQRLNSLRHTLVVLFHVDFFGLQHTSLDTRLTQEFDKRFVLRQCLMAAEQSEESGFHIFFLIRSNQTFRICKILSSQFTLCLYQTFYQRTKYFEQLFVTLRYRT